MLSTANARATRGDQPAASFDLMVSNRRSAASSCRASASAPSSRDQNSAKISRTSQVSQEARPPLGSDRTEEQHVDGCRGIDVILDNADDLGPPDTCFR